MKPRTAALILFGTFWLGCFVGLGVGFVSGDISSSPGIEANRDIDRCLAGWHKTIDDWNASTAQMNATLAGRNP